MLSSIDCLLRSLLFDLIPIPTSLVLLRGGRRETDVYYSVFVLFRYAAYGAFQGAFSFSFSPDNRAELVGVHHRESNCGAHEVISAHR